MIEKATPAERANLFFKNIEKRRSHECTLNTFRTGRKKFKLSSTKEIQLSVDGEAGPKLPVEINVQKQKVLNVVLPYQSEICSQKIIKDYFIFCYERNLYFKRMFFHVSKEQFFIVKSVSLPYNSSKKVKEI